jgi:hypothetical protein
VSGVQQQEDMGTQPDLGLGSAAVVVEERLAFGRCEEDTGRESDRRR